MHLPRAAVQGKSQAIGETALNVAALRADQAPESTLQPALRECVTRAVRRYLHGEGLVLKAELRRCVSG